MDTQKIIIYSISFTILLIAICAIALKILNTKFPKMPITIFPLDKYEQNIDHWIKPTDPDYDKPLVNATDQNKFLKEFYNRYYGTDNDGLSPWNKKCIEGKLVEEKIKEKLGESTLNFKTKITNEYDNSTKTDPKKIGYGENFHPYSKQWIENILKNMNLENLKLPLKYNPNNRGIAIKNLYARLLPTNDPYFLHPTIPGNGYPFDVLQDTALWVGAPVYIINTTLDHQWYQILDPSYSINWVPSEGIAKVNSAFIKKWQGNAKKKMVAITRTNANILNTNEEYQFNAYIGTVFPGSHGSDTNGTIKILLPIADSHHNAQIAIAKLKNKDAVIIPLKATPHNFANVMKELLGRPYGWGNMYFYNDCSADLQSLFAPFGFWLPRNSKDQATAGKKIVDLSSKNMNERLNYLIKDGKKFTTIIYIGGHVMLYIGTYSNPNSITHEPMVMSFQNTWGLRPADNSYRAVIGQSVLLPILASYPEDKKLDSYANRDKFILSYLLPS